MRPFLSFLLLLTPVSALAAPADDSCAKLPNHAALQTALKQARGQDNGGLNQEMWGTIVDRTGKICAIATTAEPVDAQWPGSRLISAEKANTANALSLKGKALSTANLYSAVQPGGFLYGLSASHPVDPSVAYAGPASAYGSENDPAVGKVLGGIITFGGGFALYDASGAILGGLGVSGDTACADNAIGWRTRHELKLDYVPGGVAADHTDAIVYDITMGKSKGGFGHPTCSGNDEKIAAKLPAVSKIAAK